jgi:hypothetical protein
LVAAAGYVIDFEVGQSCGEAHGSGTPEIGGGWRGYSPIFPISRHFNEFRDHGLKVEIKLFPLRIRRTTSLSISTPSQRDLLGNARATPVGITPFQCNDGLDEFFRRSFQASLTSVLGRKQQAVLSFSHPLVEMQKSGRLQDDGRT